MKHYIEETTGKEQCLESKKKYVLLLGFYNNVNNQNFVSISS